MANIPGLDALRLALFPVVGASEAAGPFFLSISGTVNTIGGGTGGTAMVDNNPFTPGSTSITPAGGYHGGRTVASGNAAAFAIDGSGNMQVNVVAGGAGGGVANITVRGSANSDLHVGYASGAGVNVDGGAYLPIQGSVNVGGMVGSVNVTQGTLPLPTVGSVNVQGSLGVGQLAGPWTMVGSVNVTPVATATVTFGGVATVWYGGLGADTANSAIRVNVVAGGGGGGIANLEVQGTANTAIHVGYASGAGLFADGGAAIPVLGTANIANNVGIFGSLGALVGSVNITGSINPVGIFGSLGALTGSVNITGSLNPVGVFGSVSVVGSVNAVMGTLPLPIVGSVWFGGIGADTTNSALRVNVVAGGAGGGVSNITVRGTANTDLHVGLASTNISPGYGNFPNADGAAWLPVMFPSGYYPTFNSAGGGGGGFATVAVYGSPGFPVYAIGSVNVVNNVGIFGSLGALVGSVNITGSINPVGIFGSLGALVGSVNITGSINPVGIFGSLGALTGSVNITGSLNPVGIFGSVSVVGSVNVSGSVNLAGQPILVDTRASVVPTQWVIQAGGSGAFAIMNAPSGGTTGAIKISSWMLDVSATTSMMLQSPSGTNITGSIFLLPGAGYAMANVFRNPVFQAAANATVNAWLSASTSIGGWAVGWIE